MPFSYWTEQIDGGLKRILTVKEKEKILNTINRIAKNLFWHGAKNGFIAKIKIAGGDLETYHLSESEDNTILLSIINMKKKALLIFGNENNILYSRAKKILDKIKTLDRLRALSLKADCIKNGFK